MRKKKENVDGSNKRPNSKTTSLDNPEETPSPTPSQKILLRQLRKQQRLKDLDRKLQLEQLNRLKSIDSKDNKKESKMSDTNIRMSQKNPGKLTEEYLKDKFKAHELQINDMQRQLDLLEKLNDGTENLNEYQPSLPDAYNFVIEYLTEVNKLENECDQEISNAENFKLLRAEEVENCHKKEVASLKNSFRNQKEILKNHVAKENMARKEQASKYIEEQNIDDRIFEVAENFETFGSSLNVNKCLFDSKKLKRTSDTRLRPRATRRMPLVSESNNDTSLNDTIGTSPEKFNLNQMPNINERKRKLHPLEQKLGIRFRLTDEEIAEDLKIIQNC